MSDNIEVHASATISDLIHICPAFVESQSLDVSILQALRTSIDDDLMFSELVEVYLSSAEELITEIQKNFANQLCDKYTIASHSLKSTSASIGAIKLSYICRYFERVSIEKKLLISLELLELLINEYKNVIVAIHDYIVTFMPE